jgi:hypothetical protein
VVVTPLLLVILALMVDRLFAIRAAGQAVIIMFDITSRQTYNHAGLWHKYALSAHTQRGSGLP